MPKRDCRVQTGRRSKANFARLVNFGCFHFLQPFLLVSQFGLYEDDYFYVVPWLQASSHETQ